MAKLVELKDEGRDIFGIFVGNKEIGTIHLGTEQNMEDTSIIHINLSPRFYQSRYVVSEVKTQDNTVYIRLEQAT